MYQHPIAVLALTDLKGLDLHNGSFRLKQIIAATNNFDSVNKIGEGGFGPVYRGLLSDGNLIAVMQLSSKSTWGNREFLNEIGVISCLNYPNLVKLYGCCVEGNQLLLVYEYVENNCLSHALFGQENCQLKLDWPTRQRICIGIAKLKLVILYNFYPYQKPMCRGYMAPEYAMWGYLTYKADVYSFGISTLEIVSGKHNISYKTE
ncbi:hypothetical protein DITRI_Ditri19aG0056100 [Diplodiscus trichospermus]